MYCLSAYLSLCVSECPRGSVYVFLRLGYALPFSTGRRHYRVMGGRREGSPPILRPDIQSFVVTAAGACQGREGVGGWVGG